MKKYLLAMCALLCVFTAAHAAKTVFIPAEFNTLGLDWSMTRSYESDNFVVFWGSIVGNDPATYHDATLRFNPQTICNTLETVYTKFVTDIGYCSDDPSTNLGKYKIIIMMNNTFSSPNGPTGWAFGGSYDSTIGAMWVHPQSTGDGMVISHEFAHSLQNMNFIQENTGGGGFINWDALGSFWETHANFMRTQMYPVSSSFDMARWLATSMYHWATTRNQYNAFRPLLVVQEIYGIGIVNRMWHESLPNEHFVDAFKRLQGLTQAQLNDFMYGWAKREITFDYPVNGCGALIAAEYNKTVSDNPHYIWRRFAMLNRLDGFSDRYIVPDEFAPQEYGYNLVPLHPDNTALPVCVKFKGHAETQADAGWRYGIVSVTAGGAPRYQAFYADNEKVFTFQPQADETAWYLVVLGAPTAHTVYVWEPGWPKIKRYPYEIRLSNAVPEGYQAGFRSDIKAKYAGHAHVNGGGWVANTANVAASVYVGPRAVVLGTSNISGAVVVSGTAWVQDCNITDNVVIDGNARLNICTVSQNVRVTDNAIMYYCTASGNVTAKDNMFSWGGAFSGNSVVGGDSEPAKATVDGVYLQCPHPNNGRAENDGKGAADPSNTDVNPAVTVFADADMQFNGGCSVPTGTPTGTNTATATPTPTETYTFTPTFTRTSTATQTGTATATRTSTRTATNTDTPVPSNTVTATATATFTATGTYSSTATPADTSTSTATGTDTHTATQTHTFTETYTHTLTATQTRTATDTATATSSRTATNTFTATHTETFTQTRTYTYTPTFTHTHTPVFTDTLTVTPTGTPVPATPTPTDAGIFEIPRETPVIPFPNPCKQGEDMYFRFWLTQKAESGSVRIYTAGYRLVREASISGLNAGFNTVKVQRGQASDLSPGSYYYVVTVKNAKGETAKSRAGVILILK